MSDKEYSIKIYKKGEGLEHSYDIVLPDIISKVESMKLTKQTFLEFKDCLNRFTKFINEKIASEGEALEKKLSEEDFECTLNIVAPDFKKELEKELEKKIGDNTSK